MSDGVGTLVALVKARRLGLPPAPERKRIREQAGVSLREAAQALGTTHASIRMWENGSTPRDSETVRSYTRLLSELEKLS